MKGNKPDISVYQPVSLSEKKITEIKKLFGVIEIKATFNRGINDAETAYEKLLMVHEKYPQCKVLLLAYAVSETGTGKDIYERLTGKNSDWFTFCALRENSRFLRRVLDESLDIGKIRKK